MIWIITSGSILLVLVVILIVLRNRMINALNLVESAFADIDAQLLLRYELIPKLVQITKHYAAYESDALVKAAVMRGRQQWQENHAFPQILPEIAFIKENYPDLKSNHNFEELMQKIIQVEEHLLSARKFYNGAVEAYNKLIELFPYSLISGIAGYRKRPYIAAE